MTKRNQDKRRNAHDDGPVDYSDQATQPAIPIEDERGQTGWRTPDGSMSVSINYGAARRRPSRPPDYTLQEHYESPTDQNHAPVPYSGPENFAPKPDEADEDAPETMPLSLSTFNDKPYKPWEADIRTPTPTAGATPSVYDEVPTTNYERPPAYNVQISQPVPTLSRSQPSPALPRSPPVQQHLAGGFSGVAPEQGFQAVMGTPPPSVSQPAARITRPPSRNQLPRRPSGPTIPGGVDEDDINTDVRRRAREHSGLFVADEYEHAALRRSTLSIVIGLFIAAAMALALLALLVIALFGAEIAGLLGGS